MAKVIILQGLPASGKSTWAKAKVEKSGGNWKRINKDDLRSMIDNGKYSKSNERDIILARDSLLYAFMNAGVNIIIDDTNLNPIHIDSIREDIKCFNALGLQECPQYTLEVKKFTDIKISTCIERDSKRENPVGEKVIRDMAMKYLPEKYKEEFLYVPDVTKSKAVICDIDGCLAKMCERSPYDFSKVSGDTVIEHVKELVNNYSKCGYFVIIFSGRGDECLVETRDWLENNDISFNYISLRKNGDKRPDNIVKNEMFQSVKDKYNIRLVIDDRMSVIREWCSLGLPVLSNNPLADEY